MLAFEAMPKLLDEVRNEELRTALEEHLEQTRYHAARVEQTIRDAGAEPLSARSAALAGLLEQHDAQDVKDPGLRDLHHARGAMRVEHLELGLYGVLGDGALGDGALGDGALGDGALGDGALGLLEDNRKEEEEALRRLAEIARALSG